MDATSIEVAARRVVWSRWPSRRSSRQPWDASRDARTWYWQRTVCKSTTPLRLRVRDGRTRPIEGAKARIKKFIENLDPRFISLYGGGSGQDVNGALDRVWSHTRTLNDIGH